MAQQDYICSKPDCTFAITGICLESIDDAKRQCPHLKALDSLSPPEEEFRHEVESENGDEGLRKFPTGLEMGLHDAAGLMRSRYTRLVGVLGQADAGKTSLFLSLYFQLTDRHLYPRYRFAASMTLLGFEQRARHLRDWSKGGIPDQIVDHTHLGHSRSPAFLHLSFDNDQGIRHDLLLPDLPGEWTSRLLSDASTGNRFAFLSRSDIVLIVLEAPTFSNARTRNNAITDATHLLARLDDNIRLPKTIPLVLAVTKCDQTAGEIPAGLETVASFVSDRGYSVSTVPLAAFPKQETQIPAGFGIDTLLAHLTAPCADVESHPIKIFDGAGRSYLKSRDSR